MRCWSPVSSLQGMKLAKNSFDRQPSERSLIETLPHLGSSYASNFRSCSWVSCYDSAETALGVESRFAAVVGSVYPSQSILPIGTSDNR